jgi:DNA-binding response OmpR family regulator
LPEAGATGVSAAGRLTAPAASKVRPGSLYFKDLVIDRDKHKVMVREQRLELTPKEFDLLWLLASYPGKTFSRHELLELIWGFAFQEYEHTVTSHINRLRIKLEKNLNKPEYILTTWGTGYRFAE